MANVGKLNVAVTADTRQASQTIDRFVGRTERDLERLKRQQSRMQRATGGSRDSAASRKADAQLTKAKRAQDEIAKLERDAARAKQSDIEKTEQIEEDAAKKKKARIEENRRLQRDVAREQRAELVKFQTQAAKAERNAARARQLQTGLGIGLTAASLFPRRSRRAIGTAGRLVAGGIARSGIGRAGVAGARIAGVGSLGGVLALTAGIAVIALGIRKLIQVTTAMAADQSKQLTAIVRESRVQNLSPREAQARARRAADPLDRTLDFQRRRIRELGVGVTVQQLQAATLLETSNRELTEARTALQRNIVGLVAQPTAEIRAAQANVFRSLNNLVGRAQRFYGVDPNATAPTGGGFFNAVRSLGASALSLGGSGIARAAERRGPGLGFGQSAAFANEVPGQQDAYQRQLSRAMQMQLQFLRIRGPANVLNAAPTVRADTESEYQFRVQQQRRGMQAEETRRWQQQVLELLRDLARRGLVSPEEVFEAEVRAGNVPARGVL